MSAGPTTTTVLPSRRSKRACNTPIATGAPKKRDFRGLWIQRINAGAREHGLTYSQFINGVKRAGIELDRKVLSDLAIREPAAFAAIAKQAQEALKKA